MRQISNLQLSHRQCTSRWPLPRTRPHHTRPHLVRVHAAAYKTTDNTKRSMSTLDDLLGSRDEEEQPEAQPLQVSASIQLLRVPGWAWAEVDEARVVPAASNVLYYLLLLVYTSYYVVQLADGQEVADDLLARLTNDHAAVASGDTLRLFTSFFVADTIQQLIIALIALATVAAELESLLGYSTFWALWCVTVLTGSFADAAFSSVPITAGPAAGVGGAAAALLAHHLHNWHIEQLLAQAKTGQVPEGLMQLEHAYNRQQRLKQLQQQQQAVAAESGDAPLSSSSMSSSTSTSSGEAAEEQKPGWGNVTASHDDLVETEIEGPIGISINLMLPREGKAFATLGGTAVAVIAALKDAADTDVATDWTALVAGFAMGAVLGWMVCPVYALELVPASSSGAPVKAGDGTGSSGKGADADAGGVEPDMLLPILRDTRPLAQRANVLVGAAALLFAALGVWLVSQGLFLA